MVIALKAQESFKTGKLPAPERLCTTTAGGMKAKGWMAVWMVRAEQLTPMDGTTRANSNSAYLTVMVSSSIRTVLVMRVSGNAGSKRERGPSPIQKELVSMEVGKTDVSGREGVCSLHRQ